MTDFKLEDWAARAFVGPYLSFLLAETVTGVQAVEANATRELRSWTSHSSIHDEARRLEQKIEAIFLAVKMGNTSTIRLPKDQLQPVCARATLLDGVRCLALHSQTLVQHVYLIAQCAHFVLQGIRSSDFTHCL